jgi:Lrp/AsnC family transcriptional regulator, leucine-responsive regulatory protein
MKGQLATISVDAVDAHILALLQSDARMTMRRLGEAIGLSAPAAAERVRRLENRGVIRGYHADVSPARIGLPIVAFVTVALLSPGRSPGAFERHTASLDAVVECYRITGEDTYLLKVAVPSMDALGDTLDRLGEFGRTKSFVVLATPKSGGALHPPDPASAGGRIASGAD